MPLALQGPGEVMGCRWLGIYLFVFLEGRKTYKQS